MPPRPMAAAAVGVCVLACLVSARSRAGELAPRPDDSALYIESDRDAQKLLDAARRAARARLWRQAAEACQRVVDFAGKSGAQPLVPSEADPQIFLPVQWAGALELARLPSQARAVFRTTQDEAARAFLAQAEQVFREGLDPAIPATVARATAARDVAALASVARRHLPTAAGLEALAALGAIAFERADYVAALAAWQSLLDASPSPAASLAAVQARMWVCRRALGQAQAAQALEHRLRAMGDDQVLRLAGREMPVHDFLALRIDLPAPATLSDWPSLGGDATHARVARGIREVGALAWQFGLPSSDAETRARDYAQRRLPIPLPIVATLAPEGRLLVGDGSAVVAIDPSSGQPVWRYPDAPEPAPHPAVGETIHAVGCRDGRACATLGDAVAAFDIATGRLLWKHAFVADDGAPPEEGEDARKEGKTLGTKVRVLLSAPVAAGSRVLVGVTHLGDEARARLVALDAATGHELWSTFVCSRSIPAFLGLGAGPSPPAVVGSTAFHLTNLGALAAVDAATGTIRWVRRYGSFPTHLRRSVVERHRRWANNPPIGHGGLVYVAPQDADQLLAIDAVDGSQVWSASREGGRYVVGVDGDRIFLLGQRVHGLDAWSGRRVWSVELASLLSGRAALCQGRLLVPTQDALVTVNAADGSIAVSHVWQTGEQPGNVTTAADRVYVAGQGEVAAFADWAATRERLAAARASKPDDPLPVVELGCHEARLGRHAEAVALLEESLRLARAAKNAQASRRSQDALYRSYRAQGTVEALEKALAHAPTEQRKADALQTIARLHEQQGHYAEAVGAHQALIERHADVLCHLDGTLRVTARALATAEIARLVRDHGRATYGAAEVAAAERLAAAESAADLEAVVRGHPNSAAAEVALLRLLSSPGIRSLTPQLAGLVAMMPPGSASKARRAIDERVAKLRTGPNRNQPPLERRWRIHARAAHRSVELTDLPSAAPGIAYFAVARQSFERALPFDGLEARRTDTGQLVWEREFEEWDRLAVAAGDSLVVATFSSLVALDPATGVQRWECSPTPRAPDGEEGAERPMPPPFGRPRRVESSRVVAMAGDRQLVYASLAGGKVVAVAAATGKAVWTRQLDSRALLAHGLFRDGDRLWVCSESPGQVYALDPIDGEGRPVLSFANEQVGVRRSPITDRPAFVPDHHRLYLMVNDRIVHAIDLRTGDELWVTPVAFSIQRVTASDDGKHCYVLPDSFVHNGQILSLDPATGKVVRRRSVLTSSLVDLAIAPDALYLAEKDTSGDVVVRAVDPEDLGQRWSTVPLRLFKPSCLSVGSGYVAISGRHEQEHVAVLIDAANGKIAGDVRPPGATTLSTAFRDGLFLVATDRGIYALGTPQRQQLEQAVASLAARVGRGERAALPALASALGQLGQEPRAIDLLARVLADEALPDDEYVTLKDLLNSLRESLAARRPAVLATPRMALPPNIDGAIDEPWRADRAAVLDGPAFVDEVQGLPRADARWRSPSDLSAVLYTGWDDRYFYFAVDVCDDVHRTYTSQDETWIGDGLIISVDSENDGGFGYRFTSKDLLLTLALTRKDERRDDEDGEEPNGEFRVRLKDDNSGAVYEVAVPWEYLGIRNPRPGLRFGFNVTITDDDDDHTRKAISWTPGMTLDRDHMLMIRGFNPAYFGDVLLTGPRKAPAPLWPPKASPDSRRTRVRRIRPPKEK